MPTAAPTDVRSLSTVNRTIPPLRPVDPRPKPSELSPAPPQPHQSRKLALLIKLRRSSTPIALAMILGVLPLYGWSVTTQRTWGEQYEDLEQLRRDERHLQTLTERMKHDVTERVEQNPAGFIPRGPGNVLPLTPQPPRPNVSVPQARPIPLNPAVQVPLAY
jgi:hypothetical protein